ncbi:hypothetical protein [Myxococcus xanthus]|uniref:Uncharacterized protein n=1 Tax=Myxococcus xanthus TaxID=34 RepID=A0A7Y4IDZ8_MYXXA|nr:hypothetical protein [Myxococcus xanthus]NOJ77492.1 hypothetical protein [Myxococcus xanthus]NOJ84713.1 hypothetical protein [Myxococcus xanthus]
MSEGRPPLRTPRPEDTAWEQNPAPEVAHLAARMATTFQGCSGSVPERFRGFEFTREPPRQGTVFRMTHRGRSAWLEAHPANTRPE